MKTKMLPAAVVAAVALTFAASAAYASSVLTVDGASSPVANVPVTAALAGGSFSFMTDFAVPASCTAAAASGYAVRGATVTAGTKIGAIANFSLNSCTSTGLNYPLVIEKSTDPGSPAEWGIYATATPAPGASVLPIEIRSVTIDAHSTGSTPWSYDLGMTGTVPATFNQTTQRLTINTGMSFPLAITAFDGSGTHTPSPSGVTFGGEIYTGDNMAVTGTHQLETLGTGGIHFSGGVVGRTIGARSTHHLHPTTYAKVAAR